MFCVFYLGNIFCAWRDSWMLADTVDSFEYSERPHQQNLSQNSILEESELEMIYLGGDTRTASNLNLIISEDSSNNSSITQETEIEPQILEKYQKWLKILNKLDVAILCFAFVITILSIIHIILFVKRFVWK